MTIVSAMPTKDIQSGAPRTKVVKRKPKTQGVGDIIKAAKAGTATLELANSPKGPAEFRRPTEEKEEEFTQETKEWAVECDLCSKGIFTRMSDLTLGGKMSERQAAEQMEDECSGALSAKKIRDRYRYAKKDSEPEPKKPASLARGAASARQANDAALVSARGAASARQANDAALVSASQREQQIAYNKAAKVLLGIDFTGDVKSIAYKTAVAILKGYTGDEKRVAAESLLPLMPDVPGFTATARDVPGSPATARDVPGSPATARDVPGSPPIQEETV